MEWNTIPLELLERILFFTVSPKAILSACRTCKSWNGVDADSHFWKNVYSVLSGGIVEYDERTTDWKTKVVDLVLVRDNVKSGRCVVRTLAAPEVIQRDKTLEFDNCSLYKDFCLVNWQVLEAYSSYANVTRLDSHFINLVNEEVTQMDLQEALFINHYVANSPSGYYGGATYGRIKVKKFDPKALDSKIIFDDESMLKIQESAHQKELIENDCSDSNYIGILQKSFTKPKIMVYNGETCDEIFSLACQNQLPLRRMYDNHLALCDVMSGELTIIDILTKQERKRQLKKRYVTLGFMTRNQVVIQLEEQIILWNFIDNSEVVYPAGQVMKFPIAMIYNNMWLIYREAKLYFYDMSDGSLMNTLALRQSTSRNISLLSDGRLGVAQGVGCRVISFIDSEVNRKIEVELIEVDGTVEVHEIAAHELAQFFFANVARDECMTSRVLSSYFGTPCQNDERFVMLFTSDGSSENRVANDLLRNAKKPSCLNRPYQGWKFNAYSITASSLENNVVRGKAIIVREKKIDGRWHLVSM